MTPEEQRNQKDLILGHAEELMRRVGYKAFSYQDLADRLGVSKPAIHHHFATKDTLGLALIQFYDAHFSSLVGQVEAEGRSAVEQVFAFLWLDGGPTTGCDICPLGALQMHFETFSSAMQRATVELSQRMHGWLAEKFSEARTEGEVQSWGTPEQQAVWNCAEVITKISVHDFPPSMLRDVKVHATNRHLRIQARPKAELLYRQVGFEDRAQNQMSGHLHHAIPNGRNRQRPLAAIALGNPDSKEGLRPVMLGP